MNPEHDAIIIREHARLREAIIALNKTGHASLEAILGLLHPVERNSAQPKRSPRK